MPYTEASFDGLGAGLNLRDRADAVSEQECIDALGRISTYRNGAATLTRPAPGHGGTSSMPDETIPVGYCQCGCGGKTNLAAQTVTKLGWVAGQPLDFIRFHHGRKPHRVAETPDTHCWIWHGARNPQGYGMLWTGSRAYGAHRVYYEHYRGPIPDGLEIDHLCRNPACVNPGHLEPVTAAENCHRGVNTKLTAEAVADIRTSNLNGPQLAEKYGVTRQAIYAVLKGRTWRD